MLSVTAAGTTKGGGVVSTSAALKYSPGRDSTVHSSVCVCSCGCRHSPKKRSRDPGAALRRSVGGVDIFQPEIDAQCVTGVGVRRI